MIVAAAVASVHLRTPVEIAVGAGWALVWFTFSGIAVTTTGTFVYLARRYLGRRAPGYPRLGDRLWAVLGVPWVIMSPLSRGPGRIDLYSFPLMLGVGGACLAVLAALWRAWVIGPASARGDSPRPWTDRVGLAVAFAWPLQVGFLLIVLDSESMLVSR